MRQHTVYAKVLSVTEAKHTRKIEVQCPHCGKTHTHGWPYGHVEPGHRVSHCYDPKARPNPGYTIEPWDQYGRPLQ